MNCSKPCNFFSCSLVLALLKADIFTLIIGFVIHIKFSIRGLSQLNLLVDLHCQTLYLKQHA